MAAENLVLLRLPKPSSCNKSNNLSIFFTFIPSLGYWGCRIYKYNIFHLQAWLTDNIHHDEVTVSVRKSFVNSLGWHWVTLTHTKGWHTHLTLTQMHPNRNLRSSLSVPWSWWKISRKKVNRKSSIFLKCQKSAGFCTTLPTAVNPELWILEGSENF